MQCSEIVLLITREGVGSKQIQNSETKIVGWALSIVVCVCVYIYIPYGQI